MARESKYVLVDFPEGPSIVQGCWITDDMKYSGWPPEANILSGLKYDKFLQLAQYEPKDTWTLHPINRIRAFSDDFSKVRLKVKQAEDCSETDLNSGTENGNGKGRGQRIRKQKLKTDSNHDESSEDEGPTLEDKSKAKVPCAPQPSQTLGSYKKGKEGMKSHSSHHRSQREGQSSKPSSSNEKEKPSVKVPKSSPTPFGLVSEVGPSSSNEKEKPSVKVPKSSPTPFGLVSEVGPSSSNEKENPTYKMPKAFGFDTEINGENLGGLNQEFSQNDTQSVCKTSLMSQLFYGKKSSTTEMSNIQPLTFGAYSIEKDRQKSKHDTCSDMSSTQSGTAVKSSKLTEQQSHVTEGSNPEGSLPKSVSKPSSAEPKRRKPPVIRALDFKNANKNDKDNDMKDYNDDKKACNSDKKDCNDNVIKTPQSDLSPKTVNSNESGPSKTSEKQTARQAAISMAQKLSDDEFKGYVILNFTEMRSQYKQILAEFSKLSVRPRGEARSENTTAMLDASFQEPEEDDVLFGLPAVDIDTWDRFNLKLKDDRKFASAVVGKLKDIAECQSDIGDYVRAILQRVITNSLASEYSWAGRFENKPFQNLFIMKVIKWMVKTYTKFPRVKDDIKSVTSKWLQLAPQRSGGRRFKTNKSQKSVTNIEEKNGVEDGSPNLNTTSTPRLGKKKPTFCTVGSPVRSPAKKKSKNVVRQAIESDSDLDDHMTNNISIKKEKTEKVTLKHSFTPVQQDESGSDSFIMMSSDEEQTKGSRSFGEYDGSGSERDEAEADKSATSQNF